MPNKSLKSYALTRAAKLNRWATRGYAMSNAPDLIGFEHQGWEALFTGSDRATEFYRSVLADDA